MYLILTFSVFQIALGFWIVVQYRTVLELVLLGASIGFLGLIEIAYVIFFSKKKKMIKSEAQERVAQEVSSKDSVTVEEDNNLYKEKYQDLLNLWSEVVKAMEVIFYKANEVHLFTLLESEILQEEVKGIENVSGEINLIKNNGLSIEERVQQIAGFSSEVRSETNEVQDKLSETRTMMQGIYDSHQQLQHSIKNFVENTNQIGKFLGNISQVANKTRTLSINAAIEASKSGTDGAGFAVLAREIRTLAENTGQYAKNINQLLVSIQGHTKAVMGSMNENASRIEKGFSFFEETSGYMENFNDKMLSIDTMIQEIRGNLERSVNEIQDAFQSVSILQDSSKNTQENTNQLMEIAKNLSMLGEKNMNQAMKYPISSPFFKMMRKASILRLQLEEYLEKILNSGRLTENELFHPVFEKITGSNPERYECKYQKIIFSKVQNMVENFLSDTGAANTVILDMQKYCSVAGKDFIKPLTGNPTHDAAYNLIERIYDNERVNWLNKETEDKDFYVTSYPSLPHKLAVGDLAFPLYVNGKRWGIGRIAFNPELLKG